MRQKLKLFLYMALCVVAGVPAHAQTLACRASFEAITTLRPPHLGTPPVWDAMYGPVGVDIRLGTGLQLPDGGILAAGQAKDKGAPQLVFATINGRGRVDQEKRLAIPDGDWPVKMLALKNSFVLLSDITVGTRQQARLSWYNKSLSLQQSTVLADPSFNVRSTALVMSGDGKSFLVVLHASNAAGEQSVLARFGVDGKKIWQRNFTSGVSNAINGAAPAGADGFLGAGHIRLDDGRLAGWLLRVDAHGAMSWQKIFPRGGSADLLQAAAAGPYDVLSGIVTPSGGGATGIWLLEVDVAGDALWQRFLRAPKFSLRPVALQSLSNGLVLATLNAAGEIKPPTSMAERDHIRILAFSPRGELASDDSYIESGGATAADVAPGPDNTRAIIANLLPDEKSTVNQGWVFVAPAPAAYQDPCGAK